MEVQRVQNSPRSITFNGYVGKSVYKYINSAVSNSMDNVIENANRQSKSVNINELVRIKELGDEITKKFEKFNVLRSDVLKALEEARNEKIIGKSFSADVTLCPTLETKTLIDSLEFNLGQVFIVSKFNVVDNPIDGKTFDSGVISVKAAEGVICSRCWQVVDSINEDELCPRCAEVLKK